MHTYSDEMETLRHPNNMSITQSITNLLVELSRLDISFSCIPANQRYGFGIHTHTFRWLRVTYSLCCVNFDVNIITTSQHKYVYITQALCQLNYSKFIHFLIIINIIVEIVVVIFIRKYKFPTFCAKRSR